VRPRARGRQLRPGGTAPLRALAELRFRVLWRRLRARGGVPELVAKIAGIVLAVPAAMVFAVLAGVGAWHAVRAGRGVGGSVGSAALFFGIMGAFGFFMAGLRLIIDRSRWRAVGEVLSALASLSFASLLALYGRRAITGTTALAIEVAVLGVLLIVWITVGFYWNLGRWQAKADEWVRSARRQP